MKDRSLLGQPKRAVISVGDGAGALIMADSEKRLWLILHPEFFQSAVEQPEVQQSIGGMPPASTSITDVGS